MLCTLALTLVATVPQGAVPQDSVYSTPALAAFVARAAEVNRRPPPRLHGYRAIIESELGLIINTSTSPDGAAAGTAAATTEAASQIEQLQLQASWDRSGAFTQRLTAYRSRQLAPMVSVLNMVPKPWTAPTLYGDRIALIFGGSPAFRVADSTRRHVPAVHPFAADRDHFYRFSGGDTIAKIRSGGRTIPFVQVEVTPRAEVRDTLLISGQVIVDASTGNIVRLRGRISLIGLPSDPPWTRVGRFVGQVREVAYLDFENAEFAAGYWLPRRQRLEYQVLTGLTESRATIRVQSEWRDVELDTLPAGTEPDTSDLATQYAIDLTIPDSTSDRADWYSDLGTQTVAASARDFDDVAPAVFRSVGPPALRFQARGFGDVMRYNRVEGLYLGTPWLLNLREAAPGVTIRGLIGFAFTQRAVKGGIEASRVRGGFITSVRTERQVASTNDFTSLAGRPGGNAIGALFGREYHDWVDRRITAAAVTGELGRSHASSYQLEVAAGDDRGFSHELATGAISGSFRPNRPVTNGGYMRTRAQLDLFRNRITSPLAAGFGATLLYERGDGTLNWQREEAQLAAQRILQRFSIAARVDAGAVDGSPLPTQQFLEIGGAEGLPGYAYKEFAGNRALTSRMTVTFMAPVWEKPLRFGRLVLPAIAPQLQAGVFGGQTWATPAAAPQLTALGWNTTGHWRGSLDLRLGIFAGAFSFGVARPLDASRTWRFVVGLGSGL